MGAFSNSKIPNYAKIYCTGLEEESYGLNLAIQRLRFCTRCKLRVFVLCSKTSVQVQASVPIALLYGGW